jgi:hypothetical protein
MIAYIIIVTIFFLVVLEFGFRTLCLLGKCSTI